MPECWQCVRIEKHMTAPDAMVVTIPTVPDGAVVRKEEEDLDLYTGTLSPDLSGDIQPEPPM